VRRCFHGGMIMAAGVQLDAEAFRPMPREAGAMAANPPWRRKANHPWARTPLAEYTGNPYGDG
ncbi:MAG: hypothetical protein ILP18_04200, partial [Treponema sp.]|nr:hypothetical protein [Treponema sp.]